MKLQNEIDTLQEREELWLPVVGFEGLYEVSNNGRVRSLKRILEVIRNGKITTQTNAAKMMSLSNQSEGYLEITLTRPRDGGHRYKVHRLVANAFISNPEDKLHVNHIDHNRKN